MPRHVLVIVPAGRLINNSWEKEEPPQSTIILVVWNFWLQKFEFFLKEKEEKMNVAQNVFLIYEVQQMKTVFAGDLHDDVIWLQNLLPESCTFTLSYTN